MELDINLVVVVGLLALALVVFLAWKNKKDRKKHLPPSSTDPVEEGKTNADRNKKTI